jgi:predicted N-acyltransferase
VKTILSPSIDDLGAALWDRLAEGASPMMEWGWLSALEACGLADSSSDWSTHALQLEGSDGDTLALCPVYLRDDWDGEYFDFSVFDEAALRIGLPRGPRAVVVVPWTPVPGMRILTGAAEGEARELLLYAVADGLLKLAGARGWASVHLLYCAADEEDVFVRRGFFSRRSCQYQWHNPNPQPGADFSVYLEGLSGRRRRKVLAERREFAKSGVVLSYESGSPDDFASFWEAYRETARRNGCEEPPLPRKFFEELAGRFAHRVEFVVARSGTEILGRTLNLRGDDGAWYGRYWGADDPPPLLHFEATLYAGIERCLDLGLSHFDPGYGGGHKAHRGFTPQRVHSAHWYADRMLQEGGQRFAELEAAWFEEHHSSSV